MKIFLSMGIFLSTLSFGQSFNSKPVLHDGLQNKDTLALQKQLNSFCKYLNSYCSNKSVELNFYSANTLTPPRFSLTNQLHLFPLGFAKISADDMLAANLHELVHAQVHETLREGIEDYSMTINSAEYAVQNSSSVKNKVLLEAYKVFFMFDVGIEEFLGDLGADLYLQKIDSSYQALIQIGSVVSEDEGVPFYDSIRRKLKIPASVKDKDIFSSRSFLYSSIKLDPWMRSYPHSVSSPLRAKLWATFNRNEKALLRGLSFDRSFKCIRNTITYAVEELRDESNVERLKKLKLDVLNEHAFKCIIR